MSILPPACSKHFSTPLKTAKLEIEAPVIASTPSDWYLMILSVISFRATWPTPIVSRFLEVSIFSMRFLLTVTFTVTGALWPLTVAV